jgi:hypothetical protein
MNTRGADRSGMIAWSALCPGAIARESSAPRKLAILYMVKYPTESHFEVNVSEATIEVVFKPTSSHYIYTRLVEHKDIAEFGPLSPDPRVRHAGRSGDTGPYKSPEIRAMAFRLASEAARRK